MPILAAIRKAVSDVDPLVKICHNRGIRPDDAFLVRDLARRDSATWPACCGAGCEPCVDDLIGAALELRKHTRHA